MRQQLVVLFSALLLVTYVQAWCGTHNPTHGRSGDKTEAACFSTNQCDNPSTRDSYTYVAGSSPILTQRYNVVYFGEINQTLFDEQMQFFKSRYLDLFGINVTYTLTKVTDGPYLTVDPENNTLHTEMAVQYYKEGYMTVLFTKFTDGSSLLGYASGFPTELPQNLAQWYTIMTIDGINAKGTTLPHEVGHMLGLYHTFIQQCDECAEAVSSPDRNVLGDLCNDTLPVQNEYDSCTTLTELNDCTGEPLGAAETLPLKNYMAYTPDACQTGFTPQQSGRARCYSTTTLSFLLDSQSGSPTSAPTASPITKSASAAKVSVGLLGLVALLF